MRVELAELLGGETGRDFVYYDEQGQERFSARLLDGDTALHVLWADRVSLALFCLREVQRLAGGPGAISRIIALASAELENQLRGSGLLDTWRAGQVLHRMLSGTWQVEVVRRAGSIPPVFAVQANRLED